jgi:hypothetical protein
MTLTPSSPSADSANLQIHWHTKLDDGGKHFVRSCSCSSKVNSTPCSWWSWADSAKDGNTASDGPHFPATAFSSAKKDMHIGPFLLDKASTAPPTLKDSNLATSNKKAISITAVVALEKALIHS